MPTVPPTPVSKTSPANTASPWDSVTSVPSARVALTEPLVVSTRPMDSVDPLGAACAYCPGANGPASCVTTLPFNTTPSDVAISGGGFWSKKSWTMSSCPSGPVKCKSEPSRSNSARKNQGSEPSVSCSTPAASRTETTEPDDVIVVVPTLRGNICVSNNKPCSKYIYLLIVLVFLVFIRTACFLGETSHAESILSTYQARNQKSTPT